MVKQLNEPYTEAPQSRSREAGGNSAENPKLARKLQERRLRWEWNSKLLLASGVVGLVCLPLSYASYRYHSLTAAQTFKQRALDAEQQRDYGNQVKWLSRYSMLEPDDADAIYSIALASELRVDHAAGADLHSVLDASRRELSRAIARLGDLEADSERITELRNKLIERLLQLGGNWFREAERQVALLESDPDDPHALKQMALALFGQLQSEIYEVRNSNRGSDSDDHWKQLSRQPVGEVLALAVDRNPDDLL